MRAWGRDGAYSSTECLAQARLRRLCSVAPHPLLEGLPCRCRPAQLTDPASGGLGVDQEVVTESQIGSIVMVYQLKDKK